MRPRDLDELAAMVGADPALVDPPAGLVIGPDVVVDSRLASPGALFVALTGERVDGHDYLAAAKAGGAVASLGTRRTTDDLVQLIVPDAVAALSSLARHLVDEGKRNGLQVLAVTGSSGKTSTKDLLAQVLEDAAPTVAPVGSFNNEIGVPLTACRVDDHTRYLVSEMGARGRGHIAWLCSMTPPDVAAVLNVGSAHLGEFGSVEQIALAKGEIVEALPSQGWAVLNADDPRVAAMAARTAATVAWFSVGDHTPEVLDPATRADPAALWVQAASISPDDLQRHRFELRVHRPGGAEVAEVTLPLSGRHHVANAAAAAAMALAVGLPLPSIARVLSSVRPRSRWRMELLVRPDGAAVVNDTYNANPDSMRAALETVGAIGQRRRARDPRARAIAVVGDMLELGADSAARHREVGREAARAGFDELLAIGDWAAEVVAGATEAGLAARVVSREEASSLDLRPADVVVVKASRGVGLESVAERLVPGHQDVEGGGQT